MGGTFDRFHLGHHQLITTALTTAEKVVIGVTKEPLTRDKSFGYLIEPYEVRVAMLQAELKNLGALGSTEIVALNDSFGPTLSDNEIDVIVVSTQTRPGGALINRERILRGLPPLPLIEASMVKDESGKHLSSTQIRKGLVTRSGGVYASLFAQDIRFSSSNLKLLEQPQGDLMQPEEVTSELLRDLMSVVLVGDTVTDFFITHNLPFHLGIIDGRSRRQPTQHAYSLPITTISPNPAGSIMAASAEELIHLLYVLPDTPHLVMVPGEEDLLAFIPSLVGPLGGAVFYGQPDQGIVMIRLSESIKIKLARLINPNFK